MKEKMKTEKPKTIRVKAYAKINLSLDVIGLTEDGFHRVEMLMQAIKLHDDVNVTWDSAKDVMDYEIKLKTDLPYVPDDERNIAYKAALLMNERFPHKGRVSINIHKRIPVAAGLAGGSGNGAAVVMALARLWDLDISMKELMELGAELGSDVPFSMMAQAACNGIFGLKEDPFAATCALAKGRGTQLEPAKALSSNVVLCKPPLSVSTKEVYKGIDECHVPEHPDNDILIREIEKSGGLLTEENRKIIKANMVNVLENYTINRYDSVKAIKNKIVRIVGQEKIVLMTGSGPTVFALPEDEEAARNLARQLREDNHQTFVTRTLT